MRNLHLITSILLMLSNHTFAQDTWAQKADFGGGTRYGAVGVGTSSKGYIGMGINNAGVNFQDMWEYDPSNNTWTQKADFPAGVRMGATAFSIGSKIYVGSGSYTPGNFGWLWYNDLWAFDPSNNTWTQKASYSGHTRYLAVGFSIGGKGYLGTGSYRQDRTDVAHYYNDFWEYDTLSDSWTQKANVPQQGRTSATGFSIGSKGYIGFGFYYYDTRLNDFWEYDPSAGTWTQKTSFPGIQRYGANGFGIGDKGYVGNGFYYSPLNDFWQYDPAMDSWSQKPDVGGGGRGQGIGFSIGDKGYMGLGSNSSSALSDIWEYTPCWIPQTPVVISGPVNACLFIGSSTNAVYSIPKIKYATSYSWMVPAGAQIVSHPAGPGENDTVIQVSFDNSFVSGKMISVNASSPCGQSGTRTLTIQRTLPSNPGAIDGPTDACPYMVSSTNPLGIQVSYSIRKVNNATSYNWLIATGASINAHPGGAGTENDTMVMVSFSSSYSSGYISVVAVNGCGKSITRTLTIQKKIPVTPAAITGPSNVCSYMVSATNPAGTPAVYRIRKAAYATSYAWSVPAGALIEEHPAGEGINDTVIKVKFLGSFISGSIRVVASANCGNSGTRSLQVSRGVAPATPGAISGMTNVCLMGDPAIATYSIPKVNNATRYYWSVQKDATIIGHPGNPDGTTPETDTIIQVQFNSNYMAGYIVVIAGNNCFSSGERRLSVFRTYPSIPGLITETLTSGCPDRLVTYRLQSMPLNATSVLWAIPQGANIESGQGTLELVVNYPASTSPSDMIRVAGVNGCGSGNERKMRVMLLGTCVPLLTGNANNTDQKSQNAKIDLNKRNETEIVVDAFPNPSLQQFTLSFTSSDLMTAVEMQVRDIGGRLIEMRRNLKPGDQVQIGTFYKPGIYFVTIIQSGTIKTIKLVKL